MGKSVRAFLYVVSATHSPDEVTCQVPWKVDAQEVFFGPCKRRLRGTLRKCLGPGAEAAEPPLELYLVGLSPSNSRRVRKVIWAGRVTRVMTFARAYHDLQERRYYKMRAHPKSPLHVRPLYDKGRLIGYEHRSNMHAKDDVWILDLIDSREAEGARLHSNQLLLQPGISPEDAFQRDVCAVCENLFFAEGKGITIDDEAVAILQQAQPERTIDRYAVFGYHPNGAADGRRGGHLELEGDIAGEFIAWIKRYAPDRSPSAKSEEPPTRASFRC